VIGVFDVDAICEPPLFRSAVEMFETEGLDALQCGVRISNANMGWLPLLQDVEFLSFSGFLQNARSHTTGSTMLGGNAQFIRAETLERVRDESGAVWNPKALTEDLDLGMKLHCIGANLAYCTEYVLQQGLESMLRLIRQRTRWAWGTIQTWSLAMLSLFTGLTVVNPFGTILMLVVSLSYIPLFIVGIHDEYRLAHPRTWLLLKMTILYTYHWIPAMLSGLSHIVSRQTPEWFKTSRIDPASYPK